MSDSTIDIITCRPDKVKQGLCFVAVYNCTGMNLRSEILEQYDNRNGTYFFTCNVITCTISHFKVLFCKGVTTTSIPSCQTFVFPFFTSGSALLSASLSRSLTIEDIHLCKDIFSFCFAYIHFDLLVSRVYWKIPAAWGHRLQTLDFI